MKPRPNCKKMRQHKQRKIKHNSKHGHAQTQKTKHPNKKKEKLLISPLHTISPAMCCPLLKGKRVG